MHRTYHTYNLLLLHTCCVNNAHNYFPYSTNVLLICEFSQVDSTRIFLTCDSKER